METPSTNSTISVPNSVSSSNDETRRVKFLCSFLGNIMPRPQDGKLRYVGGETRIVTVPRDIKYEELMNKMRELYEGASVLKYQQPDEDLDALVSVVNDDDVINMMEEYDKLGSSDGFTRLRIFLFSHPDQDGSSPYGDGDDRDSEKRYVDALNNLNDVGDFRNQQLESPLLSPGDEMQLAEQYLNQMNLDSGFYNLRNTDISMPQFNLHHLTIPSIGSGQHHVPIAQRYNEMEAPWSPSYYSPRHHGQHEFRSPADFPYSPSSARYCIPFGEDRLPEDYARQQINHQAIFEQQLQFSENAAYMAPGSFSGDRAGFPGNILHGPSIAEGNSNCERCQMVFPRNQPHLEQTNMGNGLLQVPVSCSDCPRNRESFLCNADPKLHHGVYPRDQNDPLSIHSDFHSHDRGWGLQNHINPPFGEARAHVTGAGRSHDRQIPDPSGMSNSHRHGNFVDSHQLPANYGTYRAGHQFGNEVFNDQAIAVPSHVHTPPSDEHGVRYVNSPYGCGTDNLYPVSHGHVSGYPLLGHGQSPMHDTPPPVASNSFQQINGSGSPALYKGNMEGSPRLHIGLDTQDPWIEPLHRDMGFDGTAFPEYSQGQALKVNPNPSSLEGHHQYAPHIQWPPDALNFGTSRETVEQTDPYSNLVDDRTVSMVPSGLECVAGFEADVPEAVKVDGRSMLEEEKDAKNVENTGNSIVQGISSPMHRNIPDNKCDEAFVNVKSNSLKPMEGSGGTVKPDLKQSLEKPNLSVQRLSFLPDLIASVKKAVIEEVEGVKAKVQKNTDSVEPELVEKQANEEYSENVQGDFELDSDNDDPSTFKIEPTKAEEEAIARGLQTIKNEDLEEIRELGSGTYGSVYHGKWKGSDVAIKRIKASCFSGRPSERERLIADFWKEALILSSLHHPNVVSFYGIVRDGPDGSLATVTEFMVNGSLKQFLKKKDRTIDRRKRLIIAMDTAFGMEYLHGKNIVHFDLKCENLLVNMRDPQRPVCKIGDLGLSKVKQQTLVSGGVRGTLPWMAPELLSGKSNMVTEKIDVYSFGIVMWELLTGEEPYADMHCASIIGGIVNNTLRPQIPTWCDPEWKALMESCWASDPAERPSFSEISRKLRSMAAAMNVK